MRLRLFLSLFVASLSIPAIPAQVVAIEIGVTPGVMDLSSTTAVVDGFTLRGASVGDEFTLGYTVENRDADEVYTLFTRLDYDPSALRFVGGTAGSILRQPVFGGLGTLSLNPIIDPEPAVRSPEDSLIALNHVVSLPPTGEDLRGTTATGPDLAITVTFEVLDATVATMIRQAFDAAYINGIGFDGNPCTNCNRVEADLLFDFQDFAVVPSSTASNPEPNTTLLIGVGLAILSTPSKRSRSAPNRTGGA